MVDCREKNNTLLGGAFTAVLVKNCTVKGGRFKGGSIHSSWVECGHFKGVTIRTATICCGSNPSQNEGHINNTILCSGEKRHDRTDTVPGKKPGKKPGQKETS